MTGSSEASISPTHVDLTNAQLGDEWDVHWIMTAFNAGGLPTAGTITELDDPGRFTLTNISLNMRDVFVDPTQANMQKLLANVFSGDDSITASAAPASNYVQGFDGNDTIDARAAPRADTLLGGQGDDVIHAGSGADWISGDRGNNTIYGGQGADTLHAGAGHDVVNGWHAGDHVQVDSGVTYTVTQVNADVHINFSNGGEMDLLNAQRTSLQPGWIVST